MEIGFTEPLDSYGTITVTPVENKHPLTNTNNVLTFFWKIRSSGFSGYEGKVNHKLIYHTDYNGVDGSKYVPGIYHNNEWFEGKAKDRSGVTIEFKDSKDISSHYIDGDYTAGQAGSFTDPQVFYSTKDGDWNDLTTWAMGSINGDIATDLPTKSDVVYIENEHHITLSNNAYSAMLQIEKDAVLDIKNFPNSDFGMVMTHNSGENGTIKIRPSSDGSFKFPKGDFSDFNRDFGTIEYYTTTINSATYVLPSDIDEYGHLNFNLSQNATAILGNTDLLVLGNLTINGVNSQSRLVPTPKTNYISGAKKAKTITVKGDVTLNESAIVFEYNYDLAQNFIINGDLIISENGGVRKKDNANNQSISIAGNLINNSIQFSGGKTESHHHRGANFQDIDVIFFGENDSYITNTEDINAYTNFTSLTVNKGTSQSSKLIIDVDGTFATPNNGVWLNLNNGTFIYRRVSDNDLMISKGSFTIPETAAIEIESSGNGKIIFSNQAVSNNDLILEGKLVIKSGDIYIGPTDAPNSDNDIEYSATSNSTIEIHGGSLTVNGKIRRAPSSEGVLKYIQTGGTVTINGNTHSANGNKDNAKLEILNASSVFNMSGGTLTIKRPNEKDSGTDYGDLFLHPASSSVTGGTIIFSSANSENYLMDSTIPLYNLEINSGEVMVKTNPLIINGDLTISTDASLDMNEDFNIPLTLKGNFINDGTYNPYKNSTTINGGAQLLSGDSQTTFYDLIVNPSISFTISDNIEVGRDLTISRGNFVINDNIVSVNQNIVNNAAYQTSTNSGGIVLTNGDNQHLISGTGTFDRLEIDDILGARLQSDISMRRNLTLTNGVLNINKYLLNLGQNANIEGSDFDEDKMIITDGVFSSSGIQKTFPKITEPTVFTYPIGVIGKYTPAKLSIESSNSVGQVRVTPVNERHPSTLSPYKVLDYYWEVESVGITELDGGMNFTYSENDIMQNASDDADYIAARLLVPGTSWNKVHEQVDTSEKDITFIYTQSDNLSGNYTAGLDAHIPDEIPAYTTISSGNWSDENIWSPTAPAGGPMGSVAIIDEAHEVTLDRNHIFSYKTTISGKLKVDKDFYGHNLGAIDGNGILYIEKDVLPAGRYTNFLNPEGNSTIELAGDDDYNILTELFSEIPNLIISGTGKRRLPIEEFVIHKSLIIDGGTLDNSLNNSTLIVNGKMELINGGSFISGTGANAIVKFNGSSMQELGGFTGTNAFNNLEINNDNGLTLTDNVEIKGELKLTRGIIFSFENALLSITNSSPTAAVSGGSAGSYVNGPMVKRINNGDSFRFPIGKNGKFVNLLELSAIQGGVANWKVEYFTPNSTSEDMNNPLTFVNSKDKWKISADAGKKANINIYWNAQSEVNPSFTTNGTNDLKIAEYNNGTSQWNLIESTATGTNSNGKIITNERITIPASGDMEVTSAIISSIDARAKFLPNEVDCGKNAGIPMTFISSSPIATPYQITYSIDGVEQPEVTVNSLPYTLPTNVAGNYKLVSFRHTVGMIGAVDDAIVTIYEEATEADAGEDQSLCGDDSTILEGNNPTVGVGVWSIIEGNGGSLSDPTQYDSEFYGVNGNGYTLRWTITNGNCESFDDVKITFPLVAKQPDNFIVYSSQVCSDASDVTYTVPYDATVNYNWSYSGTGVTITGNGNSVKLSFAIDATDGVLSVTASNNCDESEPTTMNITINQVDNVVLESDFGEELCLNSSATFTAVPDGGVWTNFNFFVDGISVQSGANPEFTSTGLASGNKVKVFATSVNGCIVETNEIEVIIAATTGIWTGAIDSDWENPNNWCNGVVPPAEEDIIIDKNSGELILDENHVLGGLNVKETGKVSIMPGATVDIRGPLTIDNNADFVINNNYTQDGLASLRTLSTITGKAKVRLTLPTNSWYYLSTPMSSPNTSQFGVDQISGTYAYTYSTGRAWVKENNPKEILKAEGMLVYYEDIDKINEHTTIEYKDVLNSGTIIKEFTTKNYYLFGNPFPVSLNWQDENWERERIYGTIWYRTRVNQELVFVTYNKDAIAGARAAIYPDGTLWGNEEELALIPPYQSVWVYTKTATAANPAKITITDAQKVHAANGGTLKSGSSNREKPDIIRIVSQNDRSRDGTVIYFSEKSEDAFDNGDSQKYFNSSDNIPEVYTRIGRDAMSINGLKPFEGSYEVPLSVRNRVEGEVELIFDLSLYRSDDVIVLHDAFMDEKINLRRNRSYRYEPLSLGDEHMRFSILINPEDYEVEDDEDFPTDISNDIYENISIEKVNDKALITIPQELVNDNGAIYIYDINGQLLSEYKSTSEKQYIELPKAKGTYIITVIADGNQVSKKIIM